MTVLAIDGGKTRCRVGWFAEGRRVADVAGPGLPHSAQPDAPARMEASIAALARALVPQAVKIEVVVAGLTGVRPDAHAAPSVAAALASATGARRVVLTSDVVVAHVGALAGAAGTVMVAGTGAIALAVGDDGRDTRVDGWGHLLGDDGSGFALARVGLASALRALDGRPGGSTALLEAALDRYGSAGGLVDAVYGARLPAGEVAGFAPAVIAAAEAGDAIADAACRAATESLAESAVTAARIAGVASEPISWQGGLLRSARLADGFRSALHRLLPHAAPAPPAGDGLDGAAWLAEHGPGRFAGHIRKHPSAQATF